MAGRFGNDSDPMPIRLTPETAALRVVSGPAAGRVFRLAAVRQVVGRHDPARDPVDIDLTGCEPEPGSVSRAHAELSWRNQHLTIVDLNSRNGTFVDGHRIDPPVLGRPFAATPLTAGSRITLGELELEVHVVST